MPKNCRSRCRPRCRAGAYVITDDGAGLASPWPNRQRRRRPDENHSQHARCGRIIRRCSTVGRRQGRAALFIWRRLARNRSHLTAMPPAWRARRRSQRIVSASIRPPCLEACRPKGRVLLVSGLGGAFGRGASAAPNCASPAAVRRWRKRCARNGPKSSPRPSTCRAIGGPGELAGLLFAELAVAGGRMEVGYPDGRRTIFRTENAKSTRLQRRATHCPMAQSSW